MRESGGKRKEAGPAERFPPILLMSKSCLWLQCIGAYILPQPSKITKITKIKSYYKGQIGRKPKREQNESKGQKAGDSCHSRLS